MTSTTPIVAKRNPRSDFFADVTKSTFGKTVVAFSVLTLIWWLLPGGLWGRRPFCLLCGICSAGCIFYATALYLIKLLPAHTGTAVADASILERIRYRAGSFLARGRKAWNSGVRDYHNDIGALALPLALVHCSFRGGSIITVALLVILGFVCVSGFVIAYQRLFVILSSLGKARANDAKVKEKEPKAAAAAGEAAGMFDWFGKVSLTLHRLMTFVLWVLLILHWVALY